MNFTSLRVKIATVNDVCQNERRLFLDNTKGTLFLSVCLSVGLSACRSVKQVLCAQLLLTMLGINVVPARPLLIYRSHD